MGVGNGERDLEGRVALVTGASSGLGARFARVLATRGARLVLGARRESLLADVRESIEAAGGHALGVSMDVTDEASVRAAYDKAENAFGPVDTVIANAGMNMEGPALDLDVAAFDQVMAVNVRGVFLTVREGARRMIAVEADGRIVIVSSITAQSVSPGLAAYSASKAAVLQLGRVLARDWANKGVNLNILCPGYIETDLNADWFGTEAGHKQIAKWPRRRLMEGDALDGAVAYLCGPASRFVTGSVVTVDDGQSL
ncbi:SDR family NAD(P)-dependent oxidoreductase [Sphingomonas sp. Sphisp66]|uniref:SDR family NAD(P)-dependent oxidoreductase n=1 Tax=Sphingomonas sp. Sphisp66 TaxID=3243051 RepID=UPI0039B3E11A